MRCELHWHIKKQIGLDEQFIQLIQTPLFAMDKILNHMLRDMTSFFIDDLNNFIARNISCQTTPFLIKFYHLTNVTLKMQFSHIFCIKMTNIR